MRNPFTRSSSPGGKRPQPTSSARRKKLVLSYVPDWIITIVLAAGFFALDKVNGYRRVFSLEDTSLRHPYAEHERIPNTALYLICFVAPILIQPVINLLTVRSWWDLHNGTLGLILSLALTGAITQFTKITVGRPRPDIVDRCQPPQGATDPTFGLTSWTICTRTDLLNDGFRSFPSGHSSLSFAGLGFLAFHLAGKLHLLDRRGHAGKAWISLGPFAAAALVAISRTMDYRHHWHDVLVGSFLGIVVSYFAYRQYYPSLASELSHRPYSPRIKRDNEDRLPFHQRHAHQGSEEARTPLRDNAGAHGYIDAHSPHQHPAQLPTFQTTDPNDPHTIGAGSISKETGRSTNRRQEAYELEGTVKRPDPGRLENVWRDGEGAISNERAPPLQNPHNTPENAQGGAGRTTAIV